MALTSKTITSNSYQGRQMRLYCEEVSADSNSNTSTINWTLYSEGGSSSYYTTGPTTIKINGVEVYYKEQVSYSAKTFPAAKGSTSGSLTVQHDADGKKTISVSMETAIYVYQTSTYSDDWTLSTINLYCTPNSTPDFTAPNTLTCKVNVPSGKKYTIDFQCYDQASSSWKSCGTLKDQTATSVTFSGETIMKKVFTYLNKKTTTSTRFIITTNGLSGNKTSAQGTCTAAASNTIATSNCKDVVATQSGTIPVTKGNSAFSSSIKVTCNGQTISDTTITTATSFTFNNTAALRKKAVTALAQTTSKKYSIEITTYYSGVQVRTTTSYSDVKSVTAPAVNTATAPNFNAINDATTTITKGDSGTTSTITVTVGGQTIGSVSQTSATSYTFNNTTALKTACFKGVGTNATATYTLKITTYYEGVQIGSAKSYTGTITLGSVNTISKFDGFSAVNSGTLTITKANSSYTSTVVVRVNNNSSYKIGALTQSDATSFTFNNTTDLRKIAFQGLAANTDHTSVKVRATITTYYNKQQVGSSTYKEATMSAPALDTVNAPTFTAPNAYNCTVTTASKELSRTLTFQIKNSSDSWVTVDSVSQSASTSFSWPSSDAKRDIIFTALGTAASRATQVLVKTYYSGVEVRGGETKTISGTCTAPAVTTGNAPNWTAGTALTYSLTRASNILYTTATLKVGSTTINTITQSNAASLTFGGTTEQDNKVFTALGGADSATSSIALTTYYKKTDGTFLQVRSAKTIEGKVTAPKASYMSNNLSWTAGNTLTVNITRANDNFKHKVILKVNNVQIATQDNVDTSTTFGNTVDQNKAIFSALQQQNGSAQIIVKTYYGETSGGVVVQGDSSKSGNCNLPTLITASAPNWTAGSSFATTINTVSGLNYSIELYILNYNTPIQTYARPQTANSLSFCTTTAQHIETYKGLAQKQSQSAYFVVKTYYEDVLVGSSTTKQSDGKCTAQKESTLSNTGSWTAGTIKKIQVQRPTYNNIYVTVNLKLGTTSVQTYEKQGPTSNNNFELNFLNSTALNAQAYQLLNKGESIKATFTATSYYGDGTNYVQIGSAQTYTTTCSAITQVQMNDLTLTPTSGTIDNSVLDIMVNQGSQLQTGFVGNMILTFNNSTVYTWTESTSGTYSYSTSAHIEELYKLMPTQTEGTFTATFTVYFKNGSQLIQTGQAVSKNIKIKASESTIKVIKDSSINPNTIALINGSSASAFIDDVSIIGGNVSTLRVTIPKGTFYVNSNTGGFITKLEAMINNETSPGKSWSSNYTLSNNEVGETKTCIKNDVTFDLGPNAFDGVTTVVTQNLLIRATDSRGYNVTYTIPIKIYPYAAPSIILTKAPSQPGDPYTKRGDGANNNYAILVFSGSYSYLAKDTTITNKIENIKVYINKYGSDGTRNQIVSATTTPSLDDFIVTKEIKETIGSTQVTKYIQFTNNGTIISSILTTLDSLSKNYSYEIKLVVTDSFGKTATDSTVILPGSPLLSFREGRIGVQIVPRLLSQITGKATDVGHPDLDVSGYIYSCSREVVTFEKDGTTTWDD